MPSSVQLGHRVSAAAANQRRLGSDAQLVEHREQEIGLRLAIAVTALPCLIGSCRCQIAAIQSDINIADILLHHFQGGGSAVERLRMGRGDAGGLLLQ